MHAIDIEFMNTLNALGGHVTLLELTAQGIRGNTHFAFTDLNNEQVADVISQFLHDQGLDNKGQNREGDDQEAADPPAQ
jgi:hypothetical protein